jgi:hypothetical protein
MVDRFSEEALRMNEFDWNFDAVPDAELVACCYWEYARESAFIRELRQRCMKEQRLEGAGDKQLHHDLQRIQSIGHPAWMFLHGFFCPPDGVFEDGLPPLRPGEVHRLTGSFPKPWQSLTKEEREFRSYIPPRGVVGCRQFDPFGRGTTLDAQEIVRTVSQQQRLRDLEQKQVRRQNPNLTDDALYRTGKLKYRDIRASAIYGSGAEYTVAEINWGIFTNEEIIQSFRKWVKANRPHDVRGPDNKGRNKKRDWLVALERLSMMRLLHHFRFRDLPKTAPSAWNRYQKREWYKERKRAGEMFRKLFPFLSKSERPLSWPTHGGRSR